MISGSLELTGHPSCQAALSFLWTYPHERSCWLTNQLVLQRIGRGWVAAGRVIDRRLLWHSCVVIRCGSWLEKVRLIAKGLYESDTEDEE